MAHPFRPPVPIVYACSGCSSAAQMANQIALMLDRAGEAEMSCIAGVGGGVPALQRVARGPRPVVALDGCRLQCVRACLARVDRVADLHVILAEHGVRKRAHADFDPAQARAVHDDVVLPRVRALADGS